MPRRELSNEELAKIIRLREIGTSWLRIQHETGIHRQMAKRAYEKWEHSKSKEELAKARIDVAAQAFAEHISDLVKLVESLVSALQMPEISLGLNNADEILDRLWMRNRRQEFEKPQDSQPVSDRREHIVWRNKLLFKSLQEHTREKVRWGALQEWKQSRDNVVEYYKELRVEAIKVITNILANQPGLKERIKTEIGRGDVTKKIADGLMETIWRGILTGKPDQMHVMKGVSVFKEGQTWLEFYQNDSYTKLDLNDEDLAKDVFNVCRWALDNLRKGIEFNSVRRLADEVRETQARTIELEQSLDELLLRPMILRTRCDLCPA